MAFNLLAGFLSLPPFTHTSGNWQAKISPILAYCRKCRELKQMPTKTRKSSMCGLLHFRIVTAEIRIAQ